MDKSRFKLAETHWWTSSHIHLSLHRRASLYIWNFVFDTSRRCYLTVIHHTAPTSARMRILLKLLNSNAMKRSRIRFSRRIDHVGKILFNQRCTEIDILWLFELYSRLWLKHNNWNFVFDCLEQETCSNIRSSFSDVLLWHSSGSSNELFRPFLYILFDSKGWFLSLALLYICALNERRQS